MTSPSVTVLTVHGRRQIVKVEPNMTVLEILETVCRKYSFPLEEYDLTHHNRVLDLSTMFRFSGLPHNALLEMAKVKCARTEDDVIILLQLEDGARPSGTFQPADSLLHVLQSLCPDRPPGDGHTLMVYMRREVYWDALGTTTLKSLGLTKGRAILRLLRRNPELAKTQANVSAPLSLVKREEVNENTNIDNTVASSEDNFVVSPPNDNRPESAQIAENLDGNAERQLDANQTGVSHVPVEQGQAALAPGGAADTLAKTSKTGETLASGETQKLPLPDTRIVIIGEREAVLFHASTAVREVNDVPDSFFNLTVPEVLQMYKQLQESVKAFEEAPLVTGPLRELQKNQNLLSTMTRYRQVVIRVQFPDRHVLQGVFPVYEKIAHVEEFVRGFLLDPVMPFYLYTTPPKMVLKPDVSLLDAGCFPQALLHISCDQSPPPLAVADDSGAAALAPAVEGCVLRPELLDQLSNALGAAVVAARAKRAAKNEQQDPPEGALADDSRVDGSGNENASEVPMAAGPSNRIPNRNFRQSGTTSQASNAREAKILKFLKK